MTKKQPVPRGSKSIISKIRQVMQSVQLDHITIANRLPANTDPEVRRILEYAHQKQQIAILSQTLMENDRQDAAERLIESLLREMDED